MAGNSDEHERTKRHVQLLPAGVPRSFCRLRYRVAAMFEGAPLLFLGVVLGVAFVFRVGIGLIRPAPAAPETELATAAAASPGPTMTPRAAPPTASADAEPHPKGHIVDPPPVASGRLRPEVASPRKKRTRGSLERPF